MLDLFGESDARNMPPHFFRRHVRINYESAIKADTSRQNFTVAPRHWYVDVAFQCDRCQEVFVFSADEQKAWYEDYGFYVDSAPKCCKSCRSEIRLLKALRQEYDQNIACALSTRDLELKRRIATVIDRLCEGGEALPAKAYDNRIVLAKQITRGDTENTA